MKPTILLPIFAVSLFANSVARGQVQERPGFQETPVFKSVTTMTGQKISYPRGRPEISSVLITIAPGAESGRHRHPVPTFVYVLEGAITIVMDDSTKREYRAGQAYLQPLEKWHNMVNLGAVAVKLLGVFVGIEGRASVIKARASRP